KIADMRDWARDPRKDASVLKSSDDLRSLNFNQGILEVIRIDEFQSEIEIFEAEIENVHKPEFRHPMMLIGVKQRRIEGHSDDRHVTLYFKLHLGSVRIPGPQSLVGNRQVHHDLPRSILHSLRSHISHDRVY